MANQDAIFALLRASDKLARRTPAESAAVLQRIYGPAIEAAARQQFIDSTLAETRAEYNASQQRLAYRGEPPLPPVAMDDLALPEAGELLPVDGETLPASLLGLIGIEPVVITGPATPEAQAAFATDLVRLQQDKQAEPGAE